MFPVHRPLAFSPDCNYLAYSGPDGRLKIWETSTGKLTQAYTPSSHLSAVCTSLAWIPKTNTQLTSKKKKKKKKSDDVTSDSLQDVSLLALGTRQGTVLIYSVSKGCLQTELSGVDSAGIQDLCWHLHTESIFSCSGEKDIVQWNIPKGKSVGMWKTVKDNVHSLAVLRDGETLLAAGKTISLWSITTHTILRNFVGHASKVFQMHVISYEAWVSGKCYFVSAAEGDRLISAWEINNPDKTALASFTLTDEPVYLNVSNPSSKDEKALMATVTRGGVVHLFEHQLNGKCSKPLSPKVTLQIAAVNNSEAAHQIPVLCCGLCDDKSRSVVVAYGDFMNVKFDKLPYSSLDEHMCLIRSVTSSEKKKTATMNHTKVKTPDVSKEVKILAPGQFAGCRSVQESLSVSVPGTSSGKKRKKARANTSDEPQQLPMEERLDLLGSVTATSQAGKGQLSLDNVVHLLLQGLHGKDDSILNQIFQLKDENVIRVTVQRIPLEVVSVFLKEVYKRIFVQKDESHLHLTWLRHILMQHFAYLSTCPELEGMLGPLYQLMEARVSLSEKMIHLRGRLDLILSQSGLNKENQDSLIPSTPLYAYQDESSDEGDAYIDELLPSHSESEADVLQDSLDDDDEGDDDDDEMELDDSEVENYDDDDDEG